MPHLFAIPRELRDEIYELTLNEPLESCSNPVLYRQRTRPSPISKDPEAMHCEKQICYPSQTSSPPAQGLLLAAKQLRAELLETVKRLGPIRYKVDISSREDNGLVVPTWVAVPLFTNYIDVLEAQWRFRARKTSSIATFDGDSQTAWGCGYSATLAMLQRFVERGVYLLGKKKRKSIHIGLLAINMDAPIDMPTALAEAMVNDIISSVDEWMVGENFFAWDDGRDERENAQFDLLTGKIVRLRFSLDGVMKKEWLLADMVERREEARRKKAMRHQERVERANRDREILQSAFRELRDNGVSEADAMRIVGIHAEDLIDG